MPWRGLLPKWRKWVFRRNACRWLLCSMVMSFVVLSSCETLENVAEWVEEGTANLVQRIEQRQIAAEQDPSNWDLSVLDTARAVDYLSPLEKNVVLEVNKIRSDPTKYAELYIKPTLRYYSGLQRSQGPNTTIQTKEGKAAVEQCIRALTSSKPRGILTPSEALSLAARDHVNDTGPKGITGHSGSDRSNPLSRIARYDTGVRYIGENIDYGYASAREIVISLLIDDGVPSRGHRKNIMEPNYQMVGVAFGMHATYRHMCVLDFAAQPK